MQANERTTVIDLTDTPSKKVAEAIRVAADESQSVIKRMLHLKYLVGYLDGLSANHASQKAKTACHYSAQVIEALREELDKQEVGHG